MSLRDRLTSGSFAVTAEISPPRGASTDPITATAVLLRDWVDAVNVTDNQGSNVRLASWAGSLAAMEAGLEPVMQMTCRDRNRIALQSDLLGASALGIRNILVMTGDHPKFGDHPEAKPVFDLDSVQLLWTLRHMRDQGAVLSGRALKPSPDCFLGAVENPSAPPAGFRAERLGKKVAAGAQFVQTQFVFDVAAFAQWMTQVRDLGLHEKCYILPGVGAVRSRNALDYMRDKVPGVFVPDDVYRRLRAVPADQTAAEGARLAAETIQQRSAMDVDLRPVRKLRESAAARSALGPIMEAVCASPADLGRLRVVCDWIQYKQNFREAVVSRPVADPKDTADTEVEIAFDLRRCADIDLSAHIKEALSQEQLGLPLEPWVPGRDSCIWRFNQLYWQALTHWEVATGREYEQSLPGGESDARNTEAARELILELFRIWDELDARHALPEELYILELGVGNGNQARTWLDEFVQLDRRHGREYYHRLRYLMGDYSPHVLERAHRAVGHHAERVSALVVEATRPSVTLGFLAGKAFLVYISNVYDNLPTDELACIHGRTYQVETQAFLTDDDASQITDRFGATRDELAKLIDRLLRIGPELLSESSPGQFPDPGQAVAFWRATWEALRLRERYVPLQGLDSYQVAPSLTGEILRPLVEGQGDVRMHVSNGALGSFTGTLPLLHPFGRIQCHDLFLTSRQQYRTGFYGPGKYDGSVVNWVNGPLLQLIASRRGFGVEFTPFRQRPGSNITTLTAQARD